MSIAEKLTAIAENQQRVYNAGESAERARCIAKHFVTTITGNGQTSISFQPPFEPDFLYIMCNDPDVITPITPTESAIVHTAYFDFRAFGKVGGMCVIGRNGGVTNVALTTTSMLTRYSIANDGTITLNNIGNSNYTGVFKESGLYFVCAIKYVEKTDKERIADYVKSLSGSGEIEFSKAKVYAAFTEAEWNGFINANKPSDWTFDYFE